MRSFTQTARVDTPDGDAVALKLYVDNPPIIYNNYFLFILRNILKKNTKLKEILVYALTK